MMPAAEEEPPQPAAEAPQKKPLLRIEKDKRKGNTATLITGYDTDCKAVRELTSALRQQLAVGGSTRDGEILLQGDVRLKAARWLEQAGYKVKRINF